MFDKNLGPFGSENLGVVVNACGLNHGLVQPQRPSQAREFSIDSDNGSFATTLAFAEWQPHRGRHHETLRHVEGPYRPLQP